MASIISGTAAAEGLLADLTRDVARFSQVHGYAPTLVAVLVGDDPASHIYVRKKIEQCRKVGMESVEHRLPADCSEEDLLALIAALNADERVHGILVQLPLPAQIDSGKVLDTIDPRKDVDGFHPVNVGRLSTGTGGLVPCTPMGCMILLRSVLPDLKGKQAVVIGKSNIVGKPVAMLLLEQGCTVTVCGRHTRNLAEVCRDADIIVAAAGTPHLVKGYWVKAGAVVIDVGINRIALDDGRSRIVGDVASDEIGHAAAFTPVPGGVGPMTIACLLLNTFRAAEAQSLVGV
ncbi:bifunctional 5,10-methylenetetrahydrofolate dehydrogenase/5,10-methenyltetrahydrofolate cyclohydrolase [Sphingobium chlorophenolicum]|uniref:Bifunctional protein FolD n=1 Tax=Sphingobium chlorophenolicum TaxID=46429 RepID=A0A081R821_SPHCR|nr:bifunctional methylenetetrahydrofolate dehydrogenase/methenyltetrahydrofolate cyclohydrolase FolD [Sphingobium chlorophenolicum]KEQ51344.1 Bifunctional protein FolD protein [Sphingobium chlorophenolicum]